MQLTGKLLRALLLTNHYEYAIHILFNCKMKIKIDFSNINNIYITNLIVNFNDNRYQLLIRIIDIIL